MQICGKKSLETILNKFFFFGFDKANFEKENFKTVLRVSASLQKSKQKKNFLEFQKLLLKIFYEWKFLVLKSSQIR